MLIILAALVLGTGAYFATDWYLKDIRRLTALRAEKDADLKRVEEKVRDLASVEQKLLEARKLQEDYDRLVPGSEELPQLLRDTSTMLTTAGVKLTSFTPGGVSPSPQLPELNQLIVSVSTSGTYEEILKMFGALKSARRLIGVTNFTIGGATAGNDPTLSCQFSMVVYFSGK